GRDRGTGSGAGRGRRPDRHRLSGRRDGCRHPGRRAGGDGDRHRAGGSGEGRASAATASPARRYPCITTSVNRILPPRKDIRPLPHSAATLALCVIKVLLIGVTSWRSDTSGPSPICSRPPATTPLGALLSGGWAGPTQRRPGYFWSAGVGRDGLRGGGRPAGGPVRTETGIEPASQPTARVLHGPFDEQVG